MNARLVPDEPSAIDEISGAHQHIAKTIATLIKRSPGGKFIKLEGQWGAGKSTVVRLLVEELINKQDGGGNNDEFLIFQYDAWVHSGDHLRRAFLASFVRRLTSGGWLFKQGEPKEKQRLDDGLDYIARRFKITKKTTQHFFSERAKLVLAGLLGFGLSVPFLLEIIKREMAVRSSLVLGVEALVIGLLGAIVIHLVADDLLGVLLKRAPDGEQTSVTETPDPTSVEFQDMFRDLMRAAMIEPNRKLLIVVDNLDRLEAEDMRATWSLLRSFLDNPLFESEEWFSRVWILVPIADSGKLAHASQSSLGHTASAIASSTMEKIFQVRFNVPPPMLHSWKSYMLNKLVFAFGTSSEDFNDILRLYEIHGEDVRTPRGIISFVNDLVILQMEWGARVPLAILAAYLVSRETLSKESFAASPPVLQIVNGPNLQMTFAMLHLHAASEDEASYLLLRPKLESLLDMGSASDVRELLKRSPGVIHVLDRYIREDIRTYGNAQARLLQALCALGPLIVEGRENADTTYFPSDRVAHLLASVYVAISQAPSLSLSHSHVVEGVLALISIDESASRAVTAILDALRRPVSSGPEASSTWMPPRDERSIWMKNLVALLSIPAVKDVFGDGDAARLILPLNPVEWSELCAELENGDHSWILARCDAGVPTDVLESSLINRIMQSVPAAPDFALLRQIRRRGNMDIFDNICIQLSLKYQQIDLEHADHAVHAFSGLLAVDKAALKPFIRKLIENGVLLRYYMAEQSVRQSSRGVVFTLLIVWAADGGLLKISPTGVDEVLRASDSVNNLLKGNVGLNEHQIANYADMLCRLELFDVLAYPYFSDFPRGLLRDLIPAVAKSEIFRDRLKSASDAASEWERFAATYALPASVVNRLQSAASE